MFILNTQSWAIIKKYTFLAHHWTETDTASPYLLSLVSIHFTKWTFFILFLNQPHWVAFSDQAGSWNEICCKLDIQMSVSDFPVDRGSLTLSLPVLHTDLLTLRGEVFTHTPGVCLYLTCRLQPVRWKQPLGRFYTPRFYGPHPHIYVCVNEHVYVWGVYT